MDLSLNIRINCRKKSAYSGIMIIMISLIFEGFDFERGDSYKEDSYKKQDVGLKIVA